MELTIQNNTDALYNVDLYHVLIIYISSWYFQQVYQRSAVAVFLTSHRTWLGTWGHHKSSQWCWQTQAPSEPLCPQLCLISFKANPKTLLQEQGFGSHDMPFEGQGLLKILIILLMRTNMQLTLRDQFGQFLLVRLNFNVYLLILILSFIKITHQTCMNKNITDETTKQ